MKLFKTTCTTQNDVIRKEINELMKKFKKKVKRIPPGVSGIDAVQVASDWGFSGGAWHYSWY